MEDVVSQYTPSRFPGFDLALDVVISIAVIVGFLVIFQSMYTAVLERTREIGILEIAGILKGTIVSVVLRETAFWPSREYCSASPPLSGCGRCCTMKFSTFAFELTAAGSAGVR